MNKLYVLFFAFLILISSVSATIYINDNRSLYRSLDDTTFIKIIPFQEPGTNITLNIRSLKTSSSGQYVSFIDGNLTDSIVENTRTLKISNNYGETFTTFPNSALPFQDVFTDYAMSDTGQVQGAVANGVNKRVWMSVDYGLNFLNVSLPGATQIYDISISPDGKIVAVSGQTISAIGVWISLNYSSFTFHSLDSVGSMAFVCVDNNIIYAGESSSDIHNSTDNGTTWSTYGATPSGVSESLCKNGKLLLDNKYSSQGGKTGSFETYGSSIYTNTDKNLTYIFAGNGTTITRSGANITTSSLYLSGFTDVKTIAVSDFTYSSIPNISICIDYNTYCSNAIYDYANSIYICAGYQYVSHCSESCKNISGVPTCSNDCIIDANSCNIPGAKKCTTSTSVGTCQDTNSDGCLEYSSGEQCGIGYYCKPSGDYFALCSDVTTFGLGNNTGFSIIPDYLNTLYTAYTLDASSRTLKAQTNNAVHTQRFYTQALASTYTARTCDYRETDLYSSPINAINNETIFSFNPTAQTSYISMKFLPTDNNVTHIRVNDMLSTSMTEILFLRNTTAKSVRVYLLNGTNIYTDYSQNSYDDLTNIEMTLRYDFISGTYTNTIIFDRVNDNKINTLPQFYAGTSIASIMINSTSVQSNGIIIKSYTTPNGFSQTLPDYDGFLPCLFDKSGSYLVRTYNNLNSQPDYTNYQDYRINVELALVDDVGTPIAEPGMTQKEKRMLWSFIITFGIAIIISLTIFIAGMSSGANTGGISFLAFLFSVLAGMLFFGVIGWMTPIIAILICILDAVFIVIGFKLVFLSSPGG